MSDEREGEPSRVRGSLGHRARSRWIQRVCPAPKRFLQDLIVAEGLRTGLDVGCGADSPFAHLRRVGFRSIGLDSSRDDIERARRAGLHDEYICEDLRHVSALPRVDVVVLSHVIEHLERDDGMRLLASVERAAIRLVYVETPHGFLEQRARDGNVYQRHLSGWFPQDLEARGYTVFGSAIRGLTGPMGAPRWLPASATRWINRIGQSYCFGHPASASVLSGFRYTDANGDLRKIPGAWAWHLAGAAARLLQEHDERDR